MVTLREKTYLEQRADGCCDQMVTRVSREPNGTRYDHVCWCKLGITHEDWPAFLAYMQSRQGSLLHLTTHATIFQRKDWYMPNVQRCVP